MIKTKLKPSHIEKRQRFYAIFNRVTNISSFPKKPLLISINNSFLSINLHIRNPENDKKRNRVLVEIGAAMNNGKLQHHMRVMSQCPEMVDEHLQWGKDTAYNVIHLITALDLTYTNQDLDHDRITEVIRYTPHMYFKVVTLSLFHFL